MTDSAATTATVPATDTASATEAVSAGPIATQTANAPTTPAQAETAAEAAKAVIAELSDADVAAIKSGRIPEALADLLEEEITINGQPQKLTLRQLKQAASIATGSYKRFHEASEKEKAAIEREARAQQVINDLRETFEQPQKLMALLDTLQDEDPRYAAAFRDYLKSTANRRELTPAEREVMRLQRELEDYKGRDARAAAERKAEEERAARSAEEARDRQAAETFFAGVAQELTATGIKPTPEIIRMAARIGESLLDAELPATPKDVAPIVIREVRALARAAAAAGDQEVVAAAKSHVTAQLVKDAQERKAQSPTHSGAQHATAPQKKISIRDWLKS